ncbi:MAG: HEPN domain-containing protein [Nanoarchaeota archaeon]
MDIHECFEKRLLRKISVDLEKSKKSLETAKTKLEEAKRLFESGFFNNSLTNAYTSMFHASRVLLYKDGVQEKSHYAVYIYIKEKYSGKIPLNLINSFNFLRDERHEIFYGFEEKINKNQAERAILDAEEFLAEVEKLYKND